MLKHFMQPDLTPTPRAEPVRPEPVRHASGPLSTRRSPETPDETRLDAAPAAELGNKLIVGPNIKLKGSEITDCEILVVEGRVEAAMHSRDIRIAVGGVFSGKAVIDVAEIHGNFEGELTARKRLVIHETGHVTGTIRYGAMMVAEGATLAGDVAMLEPGAPVARVTTDKPGGDKTKEAPEVASAEQSGAEKRPLLARA